MYKGRIFDGLIESVTEDGSGVAKDDGYTVFVKGGVIGDKCKIEITKANKSYGFGRIVDILNPSPHRVEPPCSFFPACGGCTLLHTDYEKALEIKADNVKNALSRIGGFQSVTVHPCTSSSPCFHYRNKSQYPVGGEIGNVKIGFYAPKSHTVIDSDSCLIENEETRLVVSAVRSWMNTFSVPPYNEEQGSGLVRHIYVRCGEDVMLTLVCTKRNVPYTNELLKALLSLPIHLSGVVINVNPKKTNTILGDKDVLLYGNPFITASISALSYKVSYRSFFQINSFTTPLLYEKALELCNLSGDETVFDLYCGIGTISLFLARKAKKVIGIEIVPDAVRDAKENAALNNIENTEFYTGAAEELCPRLIKNGESADVVVVDPPRKGCDERLLDAIGKMSPKRIVYVSCNVSTLARDAKFLAEKYGYSLSEAFPFDQFPHSMHVETVVQLSQQKPDDVIRVSLELDELDLTAAESKATYSELISYIESEYGLKVSNLYISQVKRKLGMEVGVNYNLPKSDKPRIPQCPPDKEKAIIAALKHFNML